MGSNAFNLANVALTASPSSNATVTYFSGNLQAQSIDVQGAVAQGNGLYEPTNNVLGFTTGGSEQARITTTGNLLIGGTTAISGGNTRVLVNSLGTNAGGTQWAGGSAGGGNVYGINGGGLVFGTYTGAVGSETYAERMRIDSSGNMGIGISSPSRKFDVNGSARFVQDNPATTGAITLRQNSGDTVGGFIQWVNNANTVEKGWMYVDTSSNMLFATVSSERMRINSAGNVSIGGGSSSNVAVGYDKGRMTVVGGQAGTNQASAAFVVPGYYQGERADLSLWSTFQNTPGDSGPRRTADVIAGFNSGNWGTEYLAFNVGNSGAANDTGAVTIERMRIDGGGNIIFSTTGAQIGSAKVSILSGTTNATQYTTIAATGGSTMSILQQQTTSVSTTATIILATPQYATLALVHGSDGTNRFSDLVLMSVGTGTVNVISSLSAAGTPAARTYSQTASTFRLAMASGTYTVQVASLGLNS